MRLIGELFDGPIDIVGDVHGEIDANPSGRFVARLIEPDTGAVLYRVSFDSLFGEYRTTAPAPKSTTGPPE